MTQHKTLFSNASKSYPRIVDITLGMGVLLSLAVLLFAPAQAFAMGLKENSVIKENVIRLGDVFYGLDYNADKVLGPAPRPGQDMVLNARTLWRIARASNVNWRPVDLSEQVTLTRAATIISAENIQNELQRELQRKGMPGKFALSFHDQMTQIVLPEDQPATFDVLRLDFNPQQDHFTAEIAAPSTQNPIRRVVLNGKVDRLVDVPVLKSSMGAGSLIRKSDIQMIEMPMKQVKGEVILEPYDLLGMAPRRVVFAGKPLRIQDIQAPQIIQRGEFVTMTFDSGVMQLTAQGRAMQNGAKGDMIRVMNQGSNQTIEAKVMGERQVLVSTF